MTLKYPPWGDEPEFEWDEDNENHIWRHHISAFELEECFEGDCEISPHKKAKSDPEKYGDRYEVRGSTAGGRKLSIIVQHVGGSLVRPITALEITK